jgi:peroxiredoxin
MRRDAASRFFRLPLPARCARAFTLDIAMKRFPVLTAAGAGLMLVALNAFAQAQSPEVVPAVEPGTKLSMPAAGTPAPDFTVEAPDGSTIRLSDYKGSIVVVDFWATWCGPCQQAMPHNSQMQDKYRDDGVVVLAVCSNDSREAFEGWVRRNRPKYSFEMAFDPAARDYDNSFVRNQYGVTGFPTIFVVGRDGRIVGMASGGGPGENPRLARLLARAGAPVDLASLPPEEENKGPATVPMVGKTPASTGLIGMGAPRPAAASAAPRFGSMELGQAVPDFTLVGEDGGEVKLSDHAGRTVVVHFFTGLRPQPYLQHIASRYGESVTVLGASTATERADFDAWVKAGRGDATYTMSWDPVGKAFMESVAYMTFGIGMFPGSVVIDAQGRLVDGVIGMGPIAGQKVYAALAKAGVKLNEQDHARALSVPAATAPAPPSGPPPIELLEAGQMAPDFVTQDLEGNDVRLADFKGQVVVLDFWATWCGPCMKAMPHLEQVHRETKDQGVVVLASCTSDSRQAFERWVRDNRERYTFLTAHDAAERGPERASRTLYGVRGIPTQFVIGRDGRILEVIVGYSGEKDVRLQQALAKAGVDIEVPAVAAAQAPGER